MKQFSLKNVICLDFEASGLGAGSYPIEAAVADCHSGECESWLIRPKEEWLSDGIWSTESFEAHKIPLAELIACGLPPELVARELNARCQGKTVLCDGGDHDRRWPLTLFWSEGEKPSLQLSDFRSFARELAEQSGRRSEIAICRSELEALSRFPLLHRAEPDARRCAETLRLLVGYP
jgi:hypothetical protein